MQAGTLLAVGWWSPSVRQGRTWSWPETVRYVGRPKNSSETLPGAVALARLAPAAPAGTVDDGRTRKVSPPPSQSFVVRIGVSTRTNPEFCVPHGRPIRSGQRSTVAGGIRAFREPLP